MVMRFRETLWFKKGALASDAQPQANDDAPPAVDEPMDPEAYVDDGTLTAADSLTYGLHTGRTQRLARFSASEALGTGQER